MNIKLGDDLIEKWEKLKFELNISTISGQLSKAFAILGIFAKIN